jgi:type VI secretion system protein ImpB
LRNKLAGNEKLEDLLVDVLKSTEQLQQLGHNGDQEGGE